MGGKGSEEGGAEVFQKGGEDGDCELGGCSCDLGVGGDQEEESGADGGVDLGGVSGGGQRGGDGGLDVGRELGGDGVSVGLEDGRVHFGEDGVDGLGF